MKHLPMLMLLFSVILTSYAQESLNSYEIKGQVVEKNSGISVPYATIVLSNDSLNIKKMQACDISGNFSIKVNALLNYSLSVSAVGYITLTLTVNLSESNTDMGKIPLVEGTELKAVTVTAQKTLVRIDADKIIYNMEADPEAQTNNALEMLAKVPLINVDAEENITLNGQSNFKVLVDGKSSSMMSSNLKEVLKGLPANSIKDIEVITNPSSKYDAEGVAGIINIITSKKTNGYNGSVSAGITSLGTINGSIYTGMKINKFSFSGRFYASEYKQPETISINNREYFNNTEFHYFQSEGSGKYNGLSTGLSIEASYEIDTFNLITLGFWSYGGSSDNSSNSEVNYLNIDKDITRSYRTNSINSDKYSSVSGNIDYQKTFKKPDKSLTLSYKLDNEPEHIKSSIITNGIVNYPTYNQESRNDATGSEHTLQLDYYDPLSKVHQIEVGLKLILRQNTSTSETYREEIKLNSDNDLDYDQYILGLYAGYVLKWKKLTTKTGLRLERTWNDGISETFGIKTKFNNRLINLVPYITFTLSPKEGSTFKTSYTQRLYRPGIWYLNPYVNDVDSMNIRYGNPSLEAEIAHSFELGYSFFSPKFNISLTSMAYFINNSIENITKIEESGAQISTYENIGKNERYGLNTYMTYRPSSKMNIFLNGSIFYSKLAANAGYKISNDGYNYYLSIGLRGNIWKNGTVNFNYGIQSSSISLQGKSTNYNYSSIGISQYMFKKKLTLTTSVSDPFLYKRNYSSESNDITFTGKSKSSYLARNFRISLTYNFGKMDLEVKKARRGIQNDDVKSGGNQQGE